MIEHITPFVAPPLLFPVLAFSALIFPLVGMVLIFINKAFKSGAALAVVGLLSLTGLLTSTNMELADRRDASQQMAERAKEIYPDVPSDAVETLFEFMFDQAPKEDFLVVRTISLPPEGNAEGYIVKKVSLIWNGEGYILAETTDGENFEPLTPSK